MRSMIINVLLKVITQVYDNPTITLSAFIEHI